jgi:tRNA-specific 2-thiouridylase
MAAMSGGVDSSVAAILLLDQGHEVLGATLRLFADEDTGSGGRCGATTDIDDAREVSQRLGLTHRIFDFPKIFQNEVIDRFAAAYAGGLTPNPCIDCNRHIKFNALMALAEEWGCEFLATGHYARREFDARLGRWLLKRALDPVKDQTYMLYNLTQAQLSRTLFPLGELDKSQVRALAAEHGLGNADKPDSQDICFVRDGDYASFLENTLGLTAPAGDFLDREGRLLGRHRGLIRYTVGQRRGLGSFGRPLYVTGLNPKDNTVRLGPEEELFVDSAVVGDVNFIAEAGLKRPMEASVQIRYRSPAEPARLEPHPAGVLVRFDVQRKSVTPGQAAVFYQGDLVLGGGTIQPTWP